MARRHGGKKWFEALGRSDYARGLHVMDRRRKRFSWPLWAQEAYCRGVINAMPNQWKRLRKEQEAGR